MLLPSRLFFLTSVTEKTKTQAQNSSQKLKEKTQPQGGTFLLLRETQEKNTIFPKKILRTEKNLHGTSFNAIFVNKHFQLSQKETQFHLFSTENDLKNYFHVENLKLKKK